MQAQSRILKNTATGHLLLELLLVWYRAIWSSTSTLTLDCCNTILSLAVFSCGIDQYLRFCALNSGCKQLSFFFALHIVKLQPDGKENISDAYNSLSFIISSVLGTSRRCFRIVPRIVVIFCLSSSTSFRLVK